MSNPNILSVSNINGKTFPFFIGTSPTDIVINPSGSNILIKINSLFVANISDELAVGVTVDFLRQGSAYKLASSIGVKPDTSLVVLGKDTSIYLEPGDTLRCYADLASYLTGVVSYEILE